MELSINERDFVRQAIREGHRIDKRGLRDVRHLSVLPGNRSGQIMVHLGDTKVYCSVSAEIVAPSNDRSFEGVLQVFVEIFPGAHPPDASSQELELSRLSIQRLLDRSIKMSRAVDTESLCILPGQQVWGVRVDVHVLDDDGCAGDASLIAAMAALQAFKRPYVEVLDGQVKIYAEFDRHPVPLTVMHCPVSVSFAFLGSTVESYKDSMTDDTINGGSNDGTLSPIVICDPTAVEEKSLDGCMTLVLNRQGEIIAAMKAGGIPLPQETITAECLLLAKEKSLAIFNALIRAIKQ